MAFSERVALRTRQGLAGLWLVIILSLFHDPFTPALTVPDSPLPLFATRPGACVTVQHHCVSDGVHALGTTLYWGILLPLLIAVIFLFGHEFWRRVCPLSFFSQFARSLGMVRRRRPWQSTGSVSAARPAKVRPDSFLARHHLQLQFGLFYLALCARILFVNSSRLALAVFLLSFIAGAVLVGFLYDGKTWCQYFCPVAPAEEFFTGPRGLFASQAHQPRDPSLKISQSMCRTLASDTAPEKSACVACKANCIDIDAEKTYWAGLMEPRRQQLTYGYAGLVIGYFLYYYLYSGNWHYYLSGIWTYEPHALSRAFAPGLYLGGVALGLPKLLAVPLVLGGVALLVYKGGQTVEVLLGRWLQRRGTPVAPEVLRHRCFTLTTFLIFNLFFVFAGYNVRQHLPQPLPTYLPVALGVLSAFWLQRTWHRSGATYTQEVKAQKGSRRPGAAFDLVVERTAAGFSVATGKGSADASSPVGNLDELMHTLRTSIETHLSPRRPEA